MKKTIINVLLLLMLSVALIVSCSQNAGENAAVGEELVDISFSTMTSRALTATREAFDEKEYVWKYEAVKDDATGLTHGQTTEAKYVVSSTTAGLKGHKITDLSQGYWNFTLYAYKAVKEGGTVTGHSDVYSFKGTVTHQKVVKGNLTVVDVTVSPNTEGYGSISFSNTILLDTLDGGHISALAEQLRMGFGVSAYETPSTPIDSSQWTNLKAGTYIVTVQVYDKDDPGMVYAIESKIVTVYTGLNTEIRGSVGELSAGIQFGNVTAEIIEATTPVIDKNTKGDTSGNVAFQSSGTIPVTASLPATTAVALLGTVTEGTTKEMTLTLEIQSEEATVSEQQTSKVYDISLMQTTVTKDSTGEVTSDVGIIKNLSTAEDKLAKYYLTATLTIDKNLEDVSVTHSTLPMIPFTGDAPDYTQDEQGTVGSEQIWKGFYNYNKGTGVLTIVTRSFSPFEVFYTEPTVVTYPVAVYDSSGNLVSGYSTVQAAVDAAAAGQTVKLLADVDLPAQVVVTKQLTLDLNGKKIFNTNDIWNDAVGIKTWSLVSVQGDGELTITGNGTLDAKKNDCYAIDVRDGATLVVENGTIVGNISSIYVLEGSAIVNGGSFDLKQLDGGKPYSFMLNCLDKNFKAGTAVITVTGGTYHKFNPANTHGEPTDPTSYVPEGYLAYFDSSTESYTVLPADAAVARIGSTGYVEFDDAFNAAKNNDTIILLADINYSTRGRQTKNLDYNLTIDLNSHSLTFGAFYKIDVKSGADFTVKNGTYSTGFSTSPGNGSHMRFENVKYVRNSASSGQAIQLYAKQNVSIDFVSCEIVSEFETPSSNINNLALLSFTGGSTSNLLVSLTNTKFTWDQDVPIAVFGSSTAPGTLSIDSYSYNQLPSPNSIICSASSYRIKQTIASDLLTFTVEKSEYWVDKVTTKPSAYVVEGDTISIGSAEALTWFAKQYDSYDDALEGKTVILTADIDMGAYLWKPIKCNFMGTFDGNGRTISNLTTLEGYQVTSNSTKYGNGLFHRVSGTVKDLTVANSTIGKSDGMGNNNINGVIAGYCNSGSFSNITVTNCLLFGFGKVGGIIGMQESGTTTITDCHVNNIIIDGDYNCAGFVGLAQGEIVISGCESSNVTFKEDVYSLNYIYHDVAEGDYVGRYWSESAGDTYYAAWGDLYTDYDQETIGGITYIGKCH